MKTIEERFWAKVDKNGPKGCWIWTGYRNEWGYGYLHMGRKSDKTRKGIRAHRFAYELLIGPIQAETLDHLCRNPACVNPAHLEPVSIQVNIHRGNGFAAQEARQTQCVRGHHFDLFNTYFRPCGSRGCRTCQQLYEVDRPRRTHIRQKGVIASNQKIQKLLATSHPWGADRARDRENESVMNRPSQELGA